MTPTRRERPGQLRPYRRAAAARRRRAVRRRRIGLAVCAVAVIAVVLVAAEQTGSGPRATSRPRRATSARVSPAKRPPRVWRIAWASAMAWAQPGVTADDATIRERIAPAIGGSAVRIRISNAFGDAPLVIGAARIARAGPGAGAVARTERRVTFHGRAGVRIPIGSSAQSDPVALPVRPGETLAVSVYVAAPDAITVHPYGNAGSVSFATANGAGDQTASPAGSGFAYASPWPRIVDALDVRATRGLGSVVVLGDSITDGFNATARWTDLLQRRIDELPVRDRRAVVNEGITANTLNPLADDYSRVGGGAAGLRRLGPDVLSQPGVSYLVLFLGTNDLFFGASADQVIQGMRTVIARAHAAGVKVIGVTLLPRAGSERWDPVQYPHHQPFLERVDAWVRSAGAFDGVINLARAVGDIYNGRCDPGQMLPVFDSGDHLHPNALGQRAMADAVDLRLFGLPSAPPLRMPIRLTPTPGCHAL